MRIVIDLQGAQTESRFRGIGRYSLSLAKAIVLNSNGKHDIIIALNGLLAESIEPIRASFDGLLEQGNIRVWDAPSPCRGGDAGYEWRREVAEYLREAFISSLKPDLIYIPSLIEGYMDDAVTSIHKFDRKTPVAVTLHDLIPLVNDADYLNGNESYKRFYLGKVEELKKADLLLSNSLATLDEGKRWLGLKEDKIVNVSTACNLRNQEFGDLKLSKEVFENKYSIDKSFVLYSGGADKRKNLSRLISSFALLPEQLKKNFQLVLAGKMPEVDVMLLRDSAKKNGLDEKCVIFTGFISDEELVWLYTNCTLFVFPSWHEGFGLPALEAMSCGAPVIGSNITSIPEVVGRDDALFDPYSEISICKKMQEVLENDKFREDLASWGLMRAKVFSWDECAKRAIEFFEGMVDSAQSHGDLFSAHELLDKLKGEIKKLSVYSNFDGDLIKTAYSVCFNHPESNERKLFIDISELVNRDAKTGVQRVTRSLLSILLREQSEEYQVCPVYADTKTPGYRYANKFLSSFLNKELESEDDAIEFKSGDIFLGLDLQHHVVTFQENYLKAMYLRGVKVLFVVYDLLPILLPKTFHDGAKEGHESWLKTIAQYDGVICISKSVAGEFAEWMNENVKDRLRPFSIDWFHLGADIKSSIPSEGLEDNSAQILEYLESTDTFLMVGTVEPRKGQDQVLEAFEVLWSQGYSVNLIIVGKQGWLVDALAERLRKHPQRDKKLFWLDGVSDEYLEKLYEASSCLIAASWGEGFGLPLIEAAQFGLPIIVRDIPVFREVAGSHAFYFQSNSGGELAESLKHWLSLFENDCAPSSKKLPWLTWEESASNLLKKLYR